MMWKIAILAVLFIVSPSDATTLTKRGQAVLEDNQKCTSIGVGPKAMSDGST